MSKFSVIAIFIHEWLNRVINKQFYYNTDQLIFPLLDVCSTIYMLFWRLENGYFSTYRSSCHNSTYAVIGNLFVVYSRLLCHADIQIMRPRKVSVETYLAVTADVRPSLSNDSREDFGWF